MMGIFDKIISIFDDTWSESGKLCKIGTIEASKGNYEKAITYFEKAIEIDHNYAEAYVCLGAGWLGLKDYQKAIEALLLAINKKFNLPGSYFNLGIAYSMAGEDSDGSLRIEYSSRAINSFQAATRLGHKNARLFLKNFGVEW
jgi:tetratricopeptide (TPR) repeat protein